MLEEKEKIILVDMLKSLYGCRERGRD